MAETKTVSFYYKGWTGRVDIVPGVPTMVGWWNAYVQIEACCAEMRAVIDKAMAEAGVLNA